MTYELWKELPDGLLKVGIRSWNRYGHALKKLVVESAKAQSFKCAICEGNQILIIEHDHSPEIGSGEKPTIYNFRGLTCSKCNFHLSIYERNREGHSTGWEHVDCKISDQEYERYIYPYSSRINTLLDDTRRMKMGELAYWRWRLFIDKFDDWKEYGGIYPWRRYFDEIRKRKRFAVKMPEQFINVLAKCMKFYSTELEKNAEFEPPDSFIKLMLSIKPLLDELRPALQVQLNKANP